MPKKNILMIVADDLNSWPTAKGLYPGVVHTPQLDKLMAQGTTFTNAHAQVALCNPSRASAWTGETPATTGVHTNPPFWFQYIAPENTLHALLKQAGYETVGAGKIYHSPGLPVQSTLFDSYSCADVDPGEGPYSGPIDELEDYQNASTIIDFLRSHDPASDKPFFATLGLVRPHNPPIVPQAFYDLYPLNEIKLPAYKPNDLADVPSSIDDADTAYLPGRLSAEEWKSEVQSYLASVSYADAMIGRVLSALRSNGLEDNTTIVVWSDNGQQLGAKDTFDKHLLWDASTRVPLIVVDPEVGERGQVVEHAVQLLDLFPTVFQLAGLPVPHQAEGRSLVPLLRDPEAPWNGAAFSSVFGSFSIRTDAWRYSRYFDGQEELYHNAVDPHEWTNLASDSRYAANKQQLSARLDAYMAKHSIIVAPPGATELTGTPQRDTLINSRSNVTMSGGAGDDVYILATGTKPAIVESPSTAGGQDTVLFDGRYDMAANVERAYVRDNRAAADLFTRDTAVNGEHPAASPPAHSSDNLVHGAIYKPDKLRGGDGNDSIYAYGGNDLLIGGRGDDILDAAGGEDTLRGGPGHDTLLGGVGRDVFTFNAVAESPAGADRDTIFGFDGVGAASGDLIDLSSIDANRSLAGDQEFVFIGTAAFSAAGQIRVFDAGAHTIVQLNTDSALGADMEIQVNDAGATAGQWAAADFVL
jgi:arylsulfatase A-like enzyme